MPSKKQGSSLRLKLIILLLLAVLLASTAFGAYSALSSSQTPVITTPSASSFVPTYWMSFVPNGTEDFVYLNLSYFLANYPNYFSNGLILSNDTAPVNLALFDTTYRLDMESASLQLVYVFGLNGTTYSDVSTAFTVSNLTMANYSGVTLYRIDNFTSGEPAWLCFLNGAMVLSVGDQEAVQALQSVLNASSAPFFVNDSLKIGYLLAASAGPQYAFGCYQGSDNNYSIDFEMQSLAVTGNGFVVRDLYHFTTVDALNSNFKTVKSNYFTTNQSLYTSSSFMVGDQIFSQTDVEDALASIG
jgi:hypothetical protein